MLVEIQNNSESTLVINYENRIYRFEGNQRLAVVYHQHRVLYLIKPQEYALRQ
ncbi:MAG: hypothetical protein PUE46_07870 [Eubacteriales bacterium]|nr:hypothetical protein [Eubacteriales bacterium]